VRHALDERPCRPVDVGQSQEQAVAAAALGRASVDGGVGGLDEVAARGVDRTDVEEVDADRVVGAVDRHVLRDVGTLAVEVRELVSPRQRVGDAPGHRILAADERRPGDLPTDDLRDRAGLPVDALKGAVLGRHEVPVEAGQQPHAREDDVTAVPREARVDLVVGRVDASRQAQRRCGLRVLEPDLEALPGHVVVVRGDQARRVRRGGREHQPRCQPDPSRDPPSPSVHAHPSVPPAAPCRYRRSVTVPRPVPPLTTSVAFRLRLSALRPAVVKRSAR
jgi:hypothetical protein